MYSIEILKAASNAFNASENYSQFKMRLDLAGVDERAALDAYRSLPRFDWLTEYMCGDEVDMHDFTFELALSKDNLEKFMGRRASRGRKPRKPVLPYMFSQHTLTGDAVEMRAVDHGEEVVFDAGNGLVSRDTYMHVIPDISHDIFMSLLYLIEKKLQKA